jgi:branched-chain amino acid transport system substrate-binding protein
MREKTIIKLAVLGLIIGIVLFSSLLVFKTGQVMEEEKLVVGAILPFSGQLSFIGEEIQKGIELANLETSGTEIRIIYEDDRSWLSTAAVNAANKLINLDKIDVGLTAAIEEAKPVKPIFEKGKTPLLVVWDSNNFLDESDYLFGTGFSTEKAGEKMASFAFKNLNLREVAVVSHKDAWAEIISESFKNEFKKQGGKIVLHERHRLDDNEFKTTLLKIKESGADGIYLPLLPPTSVNFLLQTEQLGLDIPLLGGDALIQEVIDASGKAAEGIYYTNIFSENSEELRKKYVNKYGEEPLDITLVSFGYNGLNTIMKAYEKDNDNLRNGLIKVIGPSKSLDREEKIYFVKGGIGAPL